MNWLRKIEDRLTWIAALVVLVGVSTAAGNALADENTSGNLEVVVNATMSGLPAGR
ncbi:MAG: hypothetical protein P8Y01_09760 [Woeseiaceae bacterium]|jgi:hypothetical protein